jgi:hypothetical protein
MTQSILFGNCRAYAGGDLASIIDLTFDLDAFEDLLWSLVYREMASLCPGAKSILTLRKSEDAWLESIKRYRYQRREVG